MVTLILLTLIFLVMELARAMYLWNTLPVVMQRAARAAAVTDFTDDDALTLLRQKAVFRSSAGELPLGNPITDDYVRIDYLKMNMEPVDAMPDCPGRNIVNCIADPSGPSCIRFVRARLCAPGAACGAVPYRPLLPLLSLPLTLPPFTTVVKAEMLGYLPGAGICP